MSEIHVRECTAREHATIDALAVQAWQVLREGYDPTRWEGMLKAIGGMSKLAATGCLLVAAEGDSVHGAVAYMPPGTSDPKLFRPEWPTMRMLVVRPESRGRGIGRQLSEACIERAKADHAPCIALHTSEIMTVALPMYLRRGFVKDADLEPIAGAPYGRYILRF